MSQPGNTATFESACLPHRPLLVAFAGRLTGGDVDRAEDIVQDSLIKAMAAWPRWRPDGDPVKCARAWLYRIVSNTFSHDYHRARVVGNFHAACAADILVGTLGQESEADEHEDERDTDPAVAAALAAALHRIAPLYRDVIERHYFQNQTRQDIAEALGVPAGTVASRLHRARTALHDRLRASVGMRVRDESVTSILRSRGVASRTGGYARPDFECELRSAR